MTKFKIYTESEKFVWTRKRILFGIALLSFVILAIKFYLIKNAEFINDSLAQILGFISVSAIFLGLINSFFPQELKGKLNGELIFDFSKIVINNDSYNLEDIKSIQIITGPFKGQLISSGMSAFSDRFSNGINNELIITLNTGKIIKCNFQIDHKRKIFQATNELKNYVDLGILSHENFAEISAQP